MHLIGHRKTTSEKLLEHAADLIERAQPHVDAARAKLVDEVLPAAQEAATSARDTAIPRAREAMTTARDTALPAAAAAAALAKAKADEHLPHRQPKRESHKVRKTFLALGLAGLAAAAVKALTGDRKLPYVPPAPSDAPSSTMTPPPSSGTARHAGGSPADRATAAQAGSGPSGNADPGGADPAEALSDAQDGPHPVSTPDAPASREPIESGDTPDESPFGERS